MKKLLTRYWDWGLSVLFGIGVFLFWAVGFPHALSYQEQYQLFLWTGDYLWSALCIPGGFAAWLGEMVVQFYYWPWLGAFLLALLMVALQRAAIWPTKKHRVTAVLVSFLLPLALLWLMGDPSVLLALPMALLLVLVTARLCRNIPQAWDLIVVPLIYWLAGPVAWLYVALRLVSCGWKQLWAPVLMVAIQAAVYVWVLPQWPLYSVLTGQVYYRIPLHMPSLNGYDKEMYELIRQDYLVRNERWDELVSRARDYQVRTPFSCVCVNLALAEKRQLADHMFEFYQSGQDALVMPRVRDLTSMLPTAEVFWRVGMVNASQRYMFDTQESILNAKKSGRCTKRIAECMLVNGHYRTARKQLDLLSSSLFYGGWAREVLSHYPAGGSQGQGDDGPAYRDIDAWVTAHTSYGRLRKLRYSENFLFGYEEIDKMMGLLFMHNHDNRMALDYFMGQLLLKGELQLFQQYMQWVQQYGGYSSMPLGYQDVMYCIQRQGRVQDSPYREYIRQQTKH
ncbi:MAG: DUF6057 family protein [Prevotella sp.]|nr:DUF6057 family protein [Prevotella sp.]